MFVFKNTCKEQKTTNTVYFIGAPQNFTRNVKITPTASISHNTF